MKNTKVELDKENLLINYGWVILSAIVVIGILVYYFFSGAEISKQEATLNMTCIGEKFCEDLNMDFEEDYINFDGTKSITCLSIVNDMMETEFDFKIINESLLMKTYPYCKSDYEQNDTGKSL